MQERLYTEYAIIHTTQRKGKKQTRKTLEKCQKALGYFLTPQKKTFFLETTFVENL